MRKALLFLAGLVLILGLLVVARDAIIRRGLEAGVWLLAGVKMEIAGLKTGAQPSTIEIKGLKIYDPRGFPGPLMLAVDDINIRYRWQEIFKKEVFLRQLYLSIQELDIIKSEGNHLNMDVTICRSW